MGPPAAVGVLLEPGAGLLRYADTGNGRPFAEVQRPRRRQLAGAVVCEDERRRPCPLCVADLLHAVNPPALGRRRARTRDDDCALHVAVVEFTGRAVVRIYQLPGHVTRWRVRERGRLEGPLAAGVVAPVGRVAVVALDGQRRRSARPAGHLEGLDGHACDARRPESFRDVLGSAPFPGVAAEAVGEFGQAGQQAPGRVLDPGATERTLDGFVHASPFDSGDKTVLPSGRWEVLPGGVPYPGP